MAPPPMTYSPMSYTSAPQYQMVGQHVFPGAPPYPTARYGTGYSLSPQQVPLGISPHLIAPSFHIPTFTTPVNDIRSRVHTSTEFQGNTPTHSSQLGPQNQFNQTPTHAQHAQHVYQTQMQTASQMQGATQLQGASNYGQSMTHAQYQAALQHQAQADYQGQHQSASGHVLPPGGL